MARVTSYCSHSGPYWNTSVHSSGAKINELLNFAGAATSLNTTQVEWSHFDLSTYYLSINPTDFTLPTKYVFINTILYAKTCAKLKQKCLYGLY